MNTIKLIFQNIYHGMLFAGELGKKDIFYKYWPSAYVEYYKPLSPDIACLAEVPLDTKEGDSLFLDNFSKELGLPYYKVYVNDTSWIVEGKWYGTAILSKYPFDAYESFNLPNPKLEVDHEDGTHWVMHDKGAQKAIITVGGKKINIFNLHYFPVHHFGKRIDDPELHSIREALAEILQPKEEEVSIIAGDFNNKGLEIEEAFPEVFEDGNLERSLSFNRKDFEKNFEGDGTQIDHVLYSPKGLKYINGKVEANYSDHCGLSVEFEVL